MKKLLTVLLAGLVLVALNANAITKGKGKPPPAKKHHVHKHSTGNADPVKQDATSNELPATEAPVAR